MPSRKRTQHQLVMAQLPSAMQCRRSRSVKDDCPVKVAQQGDAGVPGGQVTVGWTDTAANEHQLHGQLDPCLAVIFVSMGQLGFINFGTTTDFTTDGADSRSTRSRSGLH